MAIATVACTEPPAIVRRRQDGVRGREGQQIEETLKQIYHALHRSQQWERLLTPPTEVKEIESLEVSDLNYGPPKRTYTWRVRYHFAGRGEPLPYELDDDTKME